eukprot:1249592-Prymnesium_polylepis.1
MEAARGADLRGRPVMFSALSSLTPCTSTQHNFDRADARIWRAANLSAFSDTPPHHPDTCCGVC